jgi:hypothetical protein
MPNDAYARRSNRFRKVRVSFQIVLGALQIVSGGNGPTNAYQALNIVSRRASIDNLPHNEHDPVPFRGSIIRT